MDYHLDRHGILDGPLPTSEVKSDVTFTYDDYNNRIGKRDSIAEDETSYEYDANNRLTKEVKAVGDHQEITDYIYDANGNQLKSVKGVYVDGVEDLDLQEETMFAYNTLNQLVSSIVKGQETAYTYNVDGLRNSKRTNREVTRHVWNGSHIVLELDENCEVKATYIRGINLIFSKDHARNKRYYLYNAHGHVVHLGGREWRNNKKGHVSTHIVLHILILT